MAIKKRKLREENSSSDDQLLVDDAILIDDDMKDDLTEETTLLGAKLCGHRRTAPQETPEVIMKNPEMFRCNDCNVDLESKGLLESHKKTHLAQFSCDSCSEQFEIKSDLDVHISDQHKKRQGDEEWNCNDCPFQSIMSSHLMKHLKLTTHQPSHKIKDKRALYLDYKQCYTCKMEFEGYWNLMNHRKIMHPSNKKCRNFPLNSCTFGSECWYVHEETLNLPNQSNVEEIPSVSLDQNKCNSCGIEFNSRQVLMKHKKEIHLASVLTCANFKAGNCSRSEDECWFKHYSSDESEFSKTEEQVFCEAKVDPFPPDQFRIMMKMVADLCQKVENVEKKMVSMMRT